MSITFETWRKELLFTGNIVQDGDDSVPQPEREERFKRYVTMVESVTGSEGVEAFLALVDSLQAEDDYGAYQTTYGALRRFPARVAAQGLVSALPGLIDRHRDCAGDILAQLANGTRAEDIGRLSAFREALGESPAAQKAIMDFVIREEHGGWLDGRRRGVIRPRSAEPGAAPNAASPHR
jgi:hypothetical protein